MIAITKKIFKEDFEEKFSKMYAKELNKGTILEKYGALGTLVREYVTKEWIETNKVYESFNKKQVYYFSMEFLLGRLLGDSINNLGIREICKEVLGELNINLEDIEEIEKDQGLGNGGLGRLSACFLDSMASSSIPGHGCGIRYKYGFFDQKIINGSQVEVADTWLESINPWEIRKDNEFEEVKFYGNVICQNTGERLKFIHENYHSVKAVPYDTPIIGYKNNVVNTLRLWSAETLNKDFDFSSFNKGDYDKAVSYKNSVESISYILYPEDSFYEGKLLRLKQQYFFVSAGIQSIIRNYKKSGKNILNLDKSIAIHINDTHPTLAIPELIRILIDDEGLGFDEAFEITKNTISYTNHTILSEALEKWQVEMVQKLLPRIYMIIEEINERYCKTLWEKYTGDWNRISRMAIIGDGYVRMANLAIVASHSINGVAKLHTEILKTREMSDFYNLYPEKFNNKTNGITHRRWLINSNPKLTNLLKSTIGESFIKNPIELRNFKKHLDDNDVIDKLGDIKESNKIELANEIYKDSGIIVDPKSIFDVQVKRIHGYKRQTLNCLRIMDLYNKILENPNLDICPRTFIFGGKAAPGYYLAKNIIELINAIADKVNNDKRVNDKIKVVMMENYRVSLAEKIIKATDLSEQISTTTKEASGTSNMKFMMNGAVTIATLDGANIEIKDEVSDDNIIIFGLTSEEVINYYKNCNYSSSDIYNGHYEIREVVNDLVNGKYSRDKDKFKNIYDNLLIYNDEFFVLKDFKDYIKAQERVDELYKDQRKWQRICGINIAHSGVFSSDRTIEEYSKEIWRTNAFNKSI
ncbi:glycogen/starch/alpha-glucan phosphorylase [Eubacterium multiforme]|uniref:Alpha-1,4 glucan phosphorylase n=1 Tax=Eubacterium multiforme TaxID=83339 RepID=A0ABT9UYB8_9FIRM|nr:glycogen/starch/alpha-glucan phosphorylase [Eubacterium multiforme]MDQ0151298.1 starch phosphorylase [Eubacterium multiforme]